MDRQNSKQDATGSVALTRESLLTGDVHRRLRAHDSHAHRFVTDEERAASLASTLDDTARGEDVWVFGYGSLIWNPAFNHDAVRVGTIHGFHRRFCLWTYLGRGNAEKPGLVLGLERGGSCRGVAYRIPAPHVATELDVVWRREMLTGAYRPVWVPVRTAEGEVRAITFAINQRHERYAGRLDDEAVVQAIAAASGPLGPCCDYLFQTVEHLAGLDIHDKRLARLARTVRQARASQ